MSLLKIFCIVSFPFFLLTFFINLSETSPPLRHSHHLHNNRKYNNFASNLNFPSKPPFHITIVSEHVSCFERLFDTLDFKIPVHLIHLSTRGGGRGQFRGGGGGGLGYSHSYTQSISYSNDVLNFQNWLNQWHSDSIKLRKQSLESPLYLDTFSQIVLLAFDGRHSHISMIHQLRREASWNPRAFYFLFPNCRQGKFPSKSQSNEILENYFTYFDIYNAVIITGKVFYQFKPFEPVGQPKLLNQLLKSRWADIFPPKFENFNHYEFTVSTFDHPPYVMKSRRKGSSWTGIEISVLKSLSKKLNFTYNIIEPANKMKWGHMDKCSGHYSGLIGQITRREAELAFGQVFLVENRYRMVEQSALYTRDGLCWAVPTVSLQSKHDSMALIHPFEYTIWCLIGTAMIIATIFLSIVRRIDFSRNLEKSALQLQVREMESVWIKVWGGFLGQSNKRLFRVQKIFWVCWLLFGVVLSSVYQGILVSKLVIPLKTEQMNTIKELEESKLKLGSYEEVLSILYSRGKSVSQLSLASRFTAVEDMNKTLERIANDKDIALLAGEKYLRYQIEKHFMDKQTGQPKVHLMKECMAVLDVGFILPTGTKYINIFDKYIRRLYESGIPQKLFQIYLATAKLAHTEKEKIRCSRNIMHPSQSLRKRETDMEDCDVDSEVDDDLDFDGFIPNERRTEDKTIRVLKFMHLRETFIVLGAGLLISLCVFLFEFIGKFCSWRKNE